MLNGQTELTMSGTFSRQLNSKLRPKTTAQNNNNSNNALTE